MELSPRSGRVRSALESGACVGGLTGALDGLLVLVTGAGRLGPPRVELVGAWCAGIGVHVLGGALLAGILALLGTRPLQVSRWLVGGALWVGLFWWTRPWVFPGRALGSPERLAAAAGMVLLAWGVAGVLVAAGRAAPPWGRGVVRWVLVAVCVAGASAVAVDVGSQDARGRLGEANRDLPNVLLVVVDALRADVLPAYGGGEVETPHLDRLAREGVVFERCQVQAPVTWPSFGSILTGKYPLRHGLLYMRPGVGLRESVTIPSHLRSARRLDGRRLEARDWAAAAFMTGALTHGSRLLQGFDQTSELLDGNDLVDLESAWSRLRVELTVFRALNKLRQRLDSSLVVSTFIEWLEERRHRRFVALVHLYGTHTPYDPPADLRSRYLDPAYQGPLDSFYAHHRRAVQAGELVLDEADERRIRQLYLASVAEVDRDVGRILDALERLGLAGDTLVVLTADHGEELGEHGLWEHNWMFETNLHVPLVLRWPRRLPAGRRVDTLVETVDILPTLCELLGLEPPVATDEYGHIDGRSLAPTLLGEQALAPRPAFALNPSFAAVREGNWKLILPLEELDRGRAASGRLFDLGSDPGEHQDLARSLDPGHRDVHRRLTGVLRAWYEAQPIPRQDLLPSPRDLDDLRLLRSLGYAGD